MVAEIDVDESVLIFLDEEWDLKCEHPHHADEPEWHADGGLWFAKAPCGVSGLRCDKWVRSVQQTGGCRCQCKVGGWVHKWDDLIIIEVP